MASELLSCSGIQLSNCYIYQTNREQQMKPNSFYLQGYTPNPDLI
jgi:hypothetical protein